MAENQPSKIETGSRACLSLRRLQGDVEMQTEESTESTIGKEEK